MIIFLYGSDTFRSKQKLTALKDRFITEVDKSALNIETFDGLKIEPSQLERAISTPPFLAKKRMIVVEGLLSKPKGQKIQDEILEILNNKKDTSTENEAIIIFWEGAGKKSTYTKKGSSAVKKSDKLLASLKKEKFAQEFKELEQGDVRHFINNEVNKAKGSIEPGATHLLADIVGNDLWRLDSELKKLLAYTKNNITVSDITNLVSTKLEDDIFKLTDALGHKNNALALKLINDQLKNGITPLELLSKIIWQYKNLLLVKTFTEENGDGYQGDSVGYQLGLHPFVVKKTQAQVKNFELEKLKQAYSNLLKIDYKLKTSQLNPQVLFDLLVVNS